MPTYIVTSSNYNISKEQKKIIASGITKTHHEVTGANKYFAQVIFKETSKGNHFMGGKEVLTPEIFAQGFIRAGRSKDIKKKLVVRLKDCLVKAAGLEQSQIWIYLIDLEHSQMLEYGEILPEPGKELEWFSNLSAELKEKLSKID
jgi:phenylpyruvate tautomerase PptA (4-oxalocrotonate tautomerase family)